MGARERLTPPPGQGTPSPSPVPRSTGAREAKIPPPIPRPRRLVLIFNDQRIPVDKDPFVIGRRVSDCDLAIRDGNISRRHAAIVRHSGTYYIKDLGSTNGVQFQGARVNSRHLDEGDVFVICDYELRFTYVE